MTSTYDICIGEKIVRLRLTIASQLRLKNKFKQEIIDTIMESAGNPEKMIAVFDEALNYKENPNEGMTGEELYDALVDNGTKGMDAFAEVVFNIANASGILSDKQKEQISNGINKTFSSIFESIESNNSQLQNVNTMTEEDKSDSFREQ